MDADTSLWCFFVERRDSSGSVSPNTANQEESDQICLYHIRKSCSFQGKSEEAPSSTCRRDSCFSFQGLLPRPERVRAFLIVSWGGISAKQFCWGVEDGKNLISGNQTIGEFLGTYLIHAAKCQVLLTLDYFA